MLGNYGELTLDSPEATGSDPTSPEDQSVDLLEILRGRISKHTIPPGSRLREQEIAEEFEVPRTRVREALAALEARGLVDRVPNKGAIVARLDVAQLLDIYDVREVLEGLCARLAAERAVDGAWGSLIELFGDHMEQCVETEDYDGFIEAYDRFRAQVIAVADNPVLTDMLDAIYERTQVAIRRIIILPGRAEVGLREHRDVLKALAARDGQLAERLRRENMRSAKEYLVRFQRFVL